MRSNLLIAGIDEAGRGPLAGPVVTAAVILPEDYIHLGKLSDLADSKTLPETKRDSLANDIKIHTLYGIGISEPAEIDAINILQATLIAMQRAVAALPVTPDQILIDGNRVPDGLKGKAEAIIGGDKFQPAISAASILAKTTRDRLMRQAALRFPGFGFEKHKGYGAKAHKTALETLGPCPIHRVSYKPVKEVKELKSHFMISV